jgi:hypothetical protein
MMGMRLDCSSLGLEINEPRYIYIVILTCFRRFWRPLTSFFLRLAKALLSEHGVRPATSAFAGSTTPNPKAVVSASAAAAVESCLLTSLRSAEQLIPRATFTTRRA